MNELNSVAQTILEQLGGSKFKAMVGTTALYTASRTLAFDFKGSKKANVCSITLTPMDLYEVKFYKVRGTQVKAISKYDDIYNDMLTSVFERETGLYTSL